VEVAPATADIGGVTVKATVEVVSAMTSSESFTLNTTLANEYATLGVPLTTPVLEFIVMPVGNVPELTK
jgi:hypothetical protein